MNDTGDRLSIEQFHRLPADQRRMIVSMWQDAAEFDLFPERWREEFRDLLRRVGAGTGAQGRCPASRGGGA